MLPLARLRAMPEVFANILVNSSEGGVWTAAHDVLGPARFRVVNNTAGCTGPRLLIFEHTAPPALLLNGARVPWAALPDEWRGGAEETLRFVVSRGTLIPDVERSMNVTHRVDRPVDLAIAPRHPPITMPPASAATLPAVGTPSPPSDDARTSTPPMFVGGPPLRDVPPPFPPHATPPFAPHFPCHWMAHAAPHAAAHAPAPVVQAALVAPRAIWPPHPHAQLVLFGPGPPPSSKPVKRKADEMMLAGACGGARCDGLSLLAQAATLPEGQGV